MTSLTAVTLWPVSIADTGQGRRAEDLMSDLSPIDRFVIGTAGHIDHGKSTLVKVLTGTDPDRLAEEKARGMTIDLGFAWLQTPSGRSVSIVDVPGHERFIKNMLAGVGGIDAAMLVIAADDGPMPQTREHLAILELLQVKAGVIALTKCDLVESEWLDLIEESIKETVAGTFLANAPIVRVSAIAKTGIAALVSAIDSLLSEIARTSAQSKPRLPIDRVFSLQGFGTVVTGTLVGGALEIGQDVRIMPAGLQTRIRGLQTHSQKVERALPGSRVAINITGLAVDQLRRGDVLTIPGLLQPSHRIDVRLQLLRSAPAPMEQNDSVDFFSGAADFPVWITLLDQERLNPGDSGWVQLRFRQPTALLKGDRFIIRRASPSLTIGGGEVIDPNPVRHRRFRPDVLNSLEVLAIGTPDELLLQLLEEGPIDLKNLRLKAPSGLTGNQIDDALAQLIAEGDAVVLGSGESREFKPADIIMSETSLVNYQDKLNGILREFHRAFPLRRGMAREEIKSRLKLPGPPRAFDEFVRSLARRSIIADESSAIRLSEFAILLNTAQAFAAARYEAALVANPYSPPSPVDFGVDDDLLGAMVALGKVTKIADGLFYDVGALARIEAEVIGMLGASQSITIASFRDHFGTSRKYAQAVLEYFDQRRITRRVGDERVRFSGASAGQSTGGLV